MKPIGRSSGFTLTELMIVLVVIAILTALAAPSFSNLIEKRRLMGAAEEIYSQLTYARNESVKRSKPIYVTVTASGTTTWAFGITDREGGCDTTITVAATAESCSMDFDNNTTDTPDDRVLYRFTSEDYPNVSLDAPAFTTLPQGCVATDLDTNESCFDGVRGTARDGSIDLSTDRYEIRVDLNPIGRARMCTPPGTKAIPDYPDC